jgi:hypothetical protein
MRKPSRRYPAPADAALTAPPNPPAVTELTCYVHEGWSPRIAPASAKRNWMDDTPDSYAYRCLPLAIANAHGWEVLNPCAFEARWDGGQGPDSVEIRPDPGADPAKAPVSLFGSGTITFHIEGVFRTSPGWNLWIAGPPNSFKDGIAALGGVIETDWSPYTFTMNWRFTRPGQWIRFEENEPFCFFFPVPRGGLEKITPQLRPIEDEPDLLDAFRSWSAARAAFQTWVKETRPTKPADQWQKLYYRGLDPQGRPGPADHESRVRPAPFQEAGSRPVCPVTHKAVRSNDPKALSPQDAAAAQTSLEQAGQIIAGLFGLGAKGGDPGSRS